MSGSRSPTTRSPAPSVTHDNRAPSPPAINTPARTNFAEIPPFNNTCNQSIATDIAEIPPFSSSRNQSIASNSTYPPDVKHNPATDHRRYALSATDFSFPPKDAEASATGHRRNISNISDFAYPLSDAWRHGTIDNADMLVPGHRRHGSSTSEFTYPPSDALRHHMIDNTELPARGHRRFDSTQSTAVDTTRSSSIAYPDQLALSPELNQWKQLRDVIAAAKPGVTFQLNVYTSTPPSKPDPYADGDMEDESPRMDGSNEQYEIWHIIYSINAPLQPPEQDEEARQAPHPSPPPKITWKQFLINEARANIVPWQTFLSKICDFTGLICETLLLLLFIAALSGVVYLVVCVVARCLEWLLPFEVLSQAPRPCANRGIGEYVAATCSSLRGERRWAFWGKRSHVRGPMQVGLGVCPNPQLFENIASSTCDVRPRQRTWLFWGKIAAPLVVAVGLASLLFIERLLKDIAREREKRRKDLDQAWREICYQAFCAGVGELPRLDEENGSGNLDWLVRNE